MNDRNFVIQTNDHGGWLRVFLAKGEPAGEVAMFLSRTLNGWMIDNPKCRVRIIVPISSNGDTSELHAWYDVVPVKDSKSDVGNRSHEPV